MSASPKFSGQNSHEENVRISISEILGQPTSIRRVKKTNEDKKKTNFINLISVLRDVEDRDMMMLGMMGIDMDNHNNPFYTAIDILMEMSFSKDQINIINWFLYDRVFTEERIDDLYDENEQIIPMNTIEELYKYIKKIK